ncbi:gephyrin-like molybdotransferase Glp [Methylobacterium sp. B4]|uniref:molybdopterin molybdotransferase MoeA n=1 Tax=Methylobacterium sp. B4 TaxID=1938755 RepID=UPI000D76AC69|nr:gephyrin-like molybdotransferase Glp [Methylobacterium sp. B4]PXW62104.1 molybdopterin molybdotransferase [Methylobacterium sp. B4]
MQTSTTTANATIAMPEIAEALSQMERSLRAVGSERVRLDDAAGRICAEALAARLDAPPFAVAAMDGYALRWAEADALLAYAGVVRAGDPIGPPLAPGTCRRIFTGAPVPPRADTVVVQELTETVGERVRILPGAAPHRHIRAAGSNFRAGTPVARPGMRLSARDIGVVAAAGHAEIPVHRRPRVAVLSTGSELSRSFAEGQGAQILDANRPALKALVRAWGGVPVDLGIAPDDGTALSVILSRALATEGIDLLVTSGGASVGDFDLLSPALAGLGFEPAFDKVRMRPGKATLFGRLGHLPVLGLPGNAVAALVSALLFLKPAMSRLAGAGWAEPLPEHAVLATALPATGPRTTFLRGRLGRDDQGMPTFSVLADQDNAMLSGLALADALVIRPADAPPAAPGDPVTVIRFDLSPGF